MTEAQLEDGIRKFINERNLPVNMRLYKVEPTQQWVLKLQHNKKIGKAVMSFESVEKGEMSSVIEDMVVKALAQIGPQGAQP